MRRLARDCADEIECRYPKILRRVGGYNLDEFVRPDRPFNLAKLLVGAEGTLGIVVEAKLNLVPLPAAKAVLVIQFADLLESLEATPAILTHNPSAIEVMDSFILDHTRLSPDLVRQRQTFVEGEPANVILALLSGSVRVAAAGGEVHDLPEVLHPGDPLGDVGAFEGGPYPASGTALETTECLIIPRADFFGLLAHSPTLVRGLVHGLTQRIVSLTRELRRKA